MNSSRKQMLVSLVAGLAHAGLMAVAFAPMEFGWAALVAIVPLVWVAVGMAGKSTIDGASRVSERSEGRVSSNSETDPVDASATSRLRERLYAGRCRKRDAVMVGLGASAFYWCQQQWVMDISAAGYVPLVLYMSIYPGLFVWLLSRLHGRFPRVPLAVLVPIVWTGLEWIRGEVVWDGYAWFLLGHPLIDTPFIGAAPVVGAYGVGAIVCALVGAVYGTLWTRSVRQRFVHAGIGVAVIVVLGVMGVYSIYTVAMASEYAYANFRRIGVVQTNLPQSNKIGWSAEQRERDFARFLTLTRRAATEVPEPRLRQPTRQEGKRVSIVIWPETMFPGYFLDPLEVTLPDGTKERRMTRYTSDLLELQRELGVPFLIGALGTQNLRLEPGPDGGRVTFDKRFNSVFKIQNGEVLQGRYDKVRLTPFGETMPYVSAWPWLEKKLLSIGAAGMAFDLSRGDESRSSGIWLEEPVEEQQVPGRAAYRGIKLVTPICFEITETSLCRRLVRQAAKEGAAVILVNVTNDGWFGDWDAGRAQHALAGRWRAMELGVSVVRAANTGISCVIQLGFGSGFEEIQVDGRSSKVEGVMVADVPIIKTTTIYREIGDLCWVFPLSLAGLVILAIVRRTPNNLGNGSGTETAKAA
ncbi:MAG: apolipoprotein N-acyltransferase [Phycisphaerales bacterium]|nr:apolipoprotein N-acyltransferase [Phycisphaerales bacterium]